MIEVDGVVDRIRESMNELTLSGELAVFSEDFEDLFSSEFSDQDIRDRALDGARFISARIRARHQEENLRQLSSTNAGEIDLSNDRIIPDPRTDNVQPMIRALPTRMSVGGESAQRRTLLGNMKIESTGQSATASEPAFVYQDYELIVEQGAGTGDATIYVVDLLEPTNATFDGDKWTFNDGGTSKLPLPQELKEAIVQYVLSTAFATLREVNLSTLARRKMIQEMRPYALPRAIEEQEDLLLPDPEEVGVDVDVNNPNDDN